MNWIPPFPLVGSVVRRFLFPLVVVLVAAARLCALNEIVFNDIFGRRLNERGMVLVDWEGQIANPEIKIFVQPPSDATFPATAVVTATEPRLYFDEPSLASATGPTKTLTFTNSSPVPMFVSLFPDRSGVDQDHLLTIAFTSHNSATRTQTLNAHVVDQDQPNRTSDFNITVDFSKDTTGFFSDPAIQALEIQDAQDWAYYFAGMSTDAVKSKAQQTFIWDPNSAFTTGAYIKNANAYTGFLLYVYGVSAPSAPFRSGGEPATTAFQTSAGIALPLRRSGGHEFEIKGNFNTLGWFLSQGASDWYVATNLGNVPNDLVSISHHEMGHAIVFNEGYPEFAAFKAAGFVTDPAVVAYNGSAPAIDSSDHLTGTVDRLSGRGAFGYEYYGSVPARRWLITKTDLLVAQACGYTLRTTSPFVPLHVTTASLPAATLGTAYANGVIAVGGIPFYNWTVKSGTLPPGLILDSFSGAITGTATALGVYPFVLEVAEYDPQTAPVNVSLTMFVNPAPPTLVAAPVDATVNLGHSASFSATGSAPPVPSYQWQRLPMGTSTWIDLSDDGTYTGTATTTLSIVVTNLAMNGDQFQVVVSNSSGSATSPPVTLTVQMVFSGWQAADFTAAEQADPTVSGPDVVLGPGSETNLLKYALGLGPRDILPADTQSLVQNGSGWTFAYQRPTDRADVIYTVEISYDLQTWTATALDPQLLTSDGTTDTWQVNYTATSPTVFFRLHPTIP